jgi:hypothetical protein
LKSQYLSFVYHRDPGQVHQPCILHIPGINVIIKTEKANLTFSISIYLLSPAQYYYPTSAKDVKEFLPMFRPHQDSNQERAARLTCTIDVNSNMIDVQLPSLSNKLVLPLFLVVVELLLLLLLLLWSRKELDLEHGNETCCSDDELVRY